MKKALALALLAVVAVLSTLPAEAQPCMNCPSWWVWSNAEWGMGATCEAAEQNAKLNAHNWTWSACGVDGPCNWGEEQIVTPCMWDGSQWKADARVQYKCTINMCM